MTTTNSKPFYVINAPGLYVDVLSGPFASAAEAFADRDARNTGTVAQIDPAHVNNGESLGCAVVVVGR